jgi:hypothetical protein
MPLSYEQTYGLMKDEAFRGRTTVAVSHYATYITGEQPNVQGHPSRYRWAQQTLLAPEVATTQILPTVVQDVSVQQDGSAITDEALQSAVENAVNKLI